MGATARRCFLFDLGDTKFCASPCDTQAHRDRPSCGGRRNRNVTHGRARNNLYHPPFLFVFLSFFVSSLTLKILSLFFCFHTPVPRHSTQTSQTSVIGSRYYPPSTSSSRNNTSCWRPETYTRRIFVQLLRVPINGDTRIEPMIRESFCLSLLFDLCHYQHLRNLIFPARTQIDICAMPSLPPIN
jgi:hypothetical protein